MIYAYYAPEENATIDAKEQIENFVSEHNLDIAEFVEDQLSNKVHWEKRKLHNLVNKQAKKGDTILVYEAANLARSTLQILEVLEVMADNYITLQLIKYDETFTPERLTDTQGFLRLVQYIETDFVTKRTTDALNRRRAQGLPLGRPKGRKNKSRKLDKHKAEIKRYLALNISKASIAKLVGCHAQTLYNYLADKNLLDENEKAEYEANLKQETSEETV